MPVGSTCRFRLGLLLFFYLGYRFNFFFYFAALLKFDLYLLLFLVFFSLLLLFFYFQGFLLTFSSFPGVLNFSDFPIRLFNTLEDGEIPLAFVYYRTTFQITMIPIYFLIVSILNFLLALPFEFVVIIMSGGI